MSLHTLRVVPLAAAVFLLLGLVTAPATAAPGAQSPPPGSNGAPAPAGLELLDMLDDINKLNALNPLKLTPEQLDQIIAVTTAAEEDYNRKLTALKLDPVRKIAQEIRDTKRRALAGGEITKDFMDRVAAMGEKFLKQRDQLDADALVGLVSKLKTILTPQQVSTATQLIIDQARITPGMRTSGTKDKWFNAYVLKVFISYPRIVPLLKEMRAALAADSGAQANAENP
ncbi:MAG TPA: hypothetical protein VFB21_10555 [Chthonomonadaceae bacterium]|nr:hypothetical protein [Chthonomonadaceae bacterium]